MLMRVFSFNKGQRHIRHLFIIVVR